MEIRVNGDFEKLAQWAKRIGEAGGERSLRELADNLAEETLDLIAEGFQAETDPYGNKWKPKVFADGRQVLVGRTTRLRRGWKRKRVSARGFTVTASVVYAKYHQGGTGIYGPRKQKITPKNKKALSWETSGYVTRVNRRQALKKGIRRQLKSGTVVFRSVKGCPPRRMVPVQGAFPPKWRARYIDTCRDYWRAYFLKR